MKTNVFEFCHNGKFWDDNPRHDYDGLIRALKKEFRVLGEGTHRVGFEHGDYVIKAPKSDSGLGDNWHEAAISSNYPFFCRCKLLHNVLLVMERVDISAVTCKWNELPKWTWGVDCCQVGITKSGKLKAYDFGLH